MKADVVIIGSGISGLTAATILAKKGKRVVVVEKQPNFGGSLRQFKRKKIAFEVGFHYTGCIGEGEILNLLWQYCGVLPKLSVIPLSGGGYDHFEFNDSDNPKQVRGYFSYPEFIEELKNCFPGEHQAVERYCAAVRNICSKVPFYNTELPLTPFLRGYKDRPSSLAEFLDEITSNSYLKAVLTAPGFLYGVPASQASLEIHSLVAHGYYSGAYTVVGGGQAIVDTFLDRLAGYGAELLADNQVESVLVADGKVAGVKIEGGEEIACEQIIYTGHPATVIDRVPKGVFRPAYRHRLQELQSSLSMFGVFGKSERALNTLEGALNYYVLPGKTDVLPVSATTPHGLRPMMMTSTRTSTGKRSKTCTGSGPEQLLQQDQNGIILLRLGYWQDVQGFADSSPGNRPENYQEYKTQIATEMIQTAEQRWGDLCGTIEPLAVGTPLTFRDELTAPEGCAYGAMHCLDQFNPDVRTRLPGLFLSGQSTLMTGVVGSSISGLVAAGEIVGLESLWEELKQ